MARDTKQNLNSGKFEQPNGDVLNLSGETNIYGSLKFRNTSNLNFSSNSTITFDNGDTLTISTQIEDQNIPYYLSNGKLTSNSAFKLITGATTNTINLSGLLISNLGLNTSSSALNLTSAGEIFLNNTSNIEDLIINNNELYPKSGSTLIIRANSVDGNDNSNVGIFGGGSTTVSRGASIQIYGNEASGDVIIRQGNIANSEIRFEYGSASLSTYIADDGRIFMNKDLTLNSANVYALNFIGNSDETLKKDWVKVFDYKNHVKAISDSAGYFKWIETDEDGFGVKAQDLIGKADHLLFKDNNDKYGVDYSKISVSNSLLLMEHENIIGKLIDEINLLKGELKKWQ